MIDDIFPFEDYYLNLYIKAKDRSKDYALFENVLEFKKELPAEAHRYDNGWQPKMSIRVK
jgi:hypothetical protein